MWGKGRVFWPHGRLFDITGPLSHCPYQHNNYGPEMTNKQLLCIIIIHYDSQQW